MKHISELIAEMELRRSSGKPAYVGDWRKRIPEWSKWTPGMPGRADCPACKGLGVVRVDVPLGHPAFGKLFACDCAGPRDDE